jgi:hypothetical protein
MPYLTEDIKSTCKPSHCYGRAGDEVSIVSDEHGSVVIVEHLDGDIFPVLADRLSNMPIQNSQFGKTNTEQTIFNTVAAKKTRKATTSQTPSLF